MWHFWLTYICDKRDLTCVIIQAYVTEVTYLKYITYVTNEMWHMRQTRCGLCDKCYQCVVTYVTNVMLHIWHTWYMWQTWFDTCDIYDICDICDVYGNSDVTYATNAMWVLWQMRSDICDIFDKCDICDKRNVTYMAYVDFRGWTLQENSLNCLEIFYLKCSFKWKQLLVKTTIIILLSCVWLTAYTNWINNESVKSSPFSFNEYVWYDKLWGPSLRVVTLFSILKYSYIPTSLFILIS